MTDRVNIISRLLPTPLAALYLGVSQTTLGSLKIPQKTLGAKRLYERSDLDAFADALPYVDAVPIDEGQGCADQVFGGAH